MYEWIPMEFDLEFKRDVGDIKRYFVRANDSSRKSFTTYMPGGEIGNNGYPLESLMHRMEHCKGTINGMTLEEIMGTCQDDKIDISNLI